MTHGISLLNAGQKLALTGGDAFMHIVSPASGVAILYSLIEHFAAGGGFAYDAHGGYHFSDAKAPVSSASGKLGKCLSNTDTNSWLRYASPSTGLAIGNFDFSYAFWMKVNSTSAWQGLILQGATPVLANFYSLEISYASNVKTARITISDGVNQTSVSGPTNSINDTNWHFVVYVHDSVNDLVKISIDGGAFVTAAHATGAMVDTSGWYITVGSTVAMYMNGFLDEVGRWNRALTDTDVASLYNSGNGKTYSDLTAADKVSLLAWWSFEALDTTHTCVPGPGTLTLTDSIAALYKADGKLYYNIRISGVHDHIPEIGYHYYALIQSAGNDQNCTWLDGIVQGRIQG